MIDPKINLRVDSNTDIKLLELGSRLTQKGLGFPQYANDEVVIPALAAHGYELEDARDYTVAACWEFIIPGRGLDVVNIGAVSFPAAADTAIRAGLAAGETFERILERTTREITDQTQARVDPYRRLAWAPAPYYSVLMTGALETGVDHAVGAKYRNLGVHGAGAASAADALAAVREHVFLRRDLAAADLLEALERDYVGCADIRSRLQLDSPRVGLNDPAANELLAFLFAGFADACEAEQTRSGQRVRPGNRFGDVLPGLPGEGPMGHCPSRSSARPRMGGAVAIRSARTWHLRPAPHCAGRSASCSHSRASTTRASSTADQSPSSCRTRCSGTTISIHKVALLVRSFVSLGDQQLQLNALNADTLLDAKAHPEKHRDLIVRVWGWSGYFCELAPEYQDHVISRHIFWGLSR